MVGKDKEKFNNEKDGLESGYKVYTVHSIDMTRNRLYLNGLTVSVMWAGLSGARQCHAIWRDAGARWDWEW
jgi:hypothetical protein